MTYRSAMKRHSLYAASFYYATRYTGRGRGRLRL